MITVRQLSAFVAVAQSLNFLQASEQLHMTQPALSLAIKEMESRLGGPLLIRTTRNVSLTPEGEILLPLARQLLADWSNTEERLRQRFTLQRGAVAIAAMPAFASNQLPALLKSFRDRFPAIHITVHDVINEQVIEMVRARRVELGIGFEPEKSEGLMFEPLGSDKFVAVLPPDSALTKARQITWAQLLQNDFITLQRPSAMRRLLEKKLEEHGLKPDVTAESHQLATIGRMVANGLGYSAVPALCIRQMEELGAVCRPLHEPVVEQLVGIITHSGENLSMTVQTLAGVIRECFSPWQ